MTFAPMPGSRSFPSLPRFPLVWVLAAVLVVPLGVGVQRARYDLRSYALLARFMYPQASNALLRLETNAISVQDVTVPTTNGDIRARLYLPNGVAHPPGIVIVHGIHHLGIDEPRLMSLARATAEAGFAVLTPEVAALADYHVDATSIATIGQSPAWLERRLGTGPVTVIGVSFAGGLALLAARDPQYAPHIRALILMGAYDSLDRVSRFLASDRAEFPDGQWGPYKAHEYGAEVMVYANLDHFFPAADLPVARTALRDFLWEQPEKAQPLLAELSPAARATMETLLAHKVAELRPKLLAVINAEGAQLAALSPEGKLGDLRLPVFILHGSTDDIIPSTESQWLARELPPSDLRAVLITPAFAHVDPEKDTRRMDELRLVDFLGRALQTAASANLR